MKIYDISMVLDENIPVYNNKPENRPEFVVGRDFNTGSVYETIVKMNLHTGTHIDAPLHMIQGGGTIDGPELSRLLVACTVYDFTDVQDRITSEHLKTRDIQPGSFILLKTRNSYYDGFDKEFVFVDASGAAYLKECRISGVGIDSLGIERAQPGHETHKQLLGSGIIILEGLKLADVSEGTYQMIALPLKMSGTEAAPARVILLEK